MATRRVAPKVNPFHPNEPVPPELFVGRQKEVSTLTRSLEQTIRGRPESVLVIGPRGSGKTSLAQYSANLAREFDERLDGKEESVQPVVVQCGSHTSIRDFVGGVLDGVYEAGRTSGGALLKKLTTALEGLKVEIGPVSLDLAKIEKDVVQSFPKILKRLWDTEIQKKHGALQLLIDETDALGRIPEFPGFLKNAIEQVSTAPKANIQFVVTVVDETLQTIIKNHGSFARIFHVVSLLPLEQDEIKPLVKKCLDEVGGWSFDEEFLEYLTMYTAGVPNYVHQFCYNAFEVCGTKTLTKGDLLLGAAGTPQIRGAFEILWEKHYKSRYAADITGPIKRRILHAMSLFDEPAPNREIEGLYLKIFGEPPSSNLAVYLKNLLNDGAIVRHGKSRPYTYAVAEPGFKVLLRFHPDTSKQIHSQIKDFMMRDSFEARKVSL